MADPVSGAEALERVHHERLAAGGDPCLAQHWRVPEPRDAGHGSLILTGHGLGIIEVPDDADPDSVRVGEIDVMLPADVNGSDTASRETARP